MATTFYKKERSKSQQATTQEPCLNCGSKPSESCHLVGWLDLKKLGFPAMVISQDWNLAPLCRPCHWLYDNRSDIYVGSALKALSLAGKTDQLLQVFRENLASFKGKKIILSELTDDEIEDIQDDEPFVGDISEIVFGQGDKGYLVTKFFTIACESIDTEEDVKLIELMWGKTIKDVGGLSKKEWLLKRGELQIEFVQKRSALISTLKEKIDLANTTLISLAKTHLTAVDIKVGAEWNSDFNVTGFQLDHLSSDGIIKVHLWKRG